MLSRPYSGGDGGIILPFVKGAQGFLSERAADLNGLVSLITLAKIHVYPRKK